MVKSKVRLGHVRSPMVHGPHGAPMGRPVGDGRCPNPIFPLGLYGNIHVPGALWNLGLGRVIVFGANDIARGFSNCLLGLV